MYTVTFYAVIFIGIVIFFLLLCTYSMYLLLWYIIPVYQVDGGQAYIIWIMKNKFDSLKYEMLHCFVSECTCLTDACQ